MLSTSEKLLAYDRNALMKKLLVVVYIWWLDVYQFCHGVSKNHGEKIQYIFFFCVCLLHIIRDKRDADQWFLSRIRSGTKSDAEDFLLSVAVLKKTLHGWRYKRFEENLYFCKSCTD